MKNTGIPYEKFVQQLYQKLQTLKYENYQNIIIEHHKYIPDKNGTRREFDIYWKYEYLGIEYETVIECKDYASDISIDKIDAFIGKIQDIPNLRGIFATKSDYQSGAKIKAEKNGIGLYVIREQNDSDWVDKEGNYFLKEIYIDIPIQLKGGLVVPFKILIDFSKDIIGVIENISKHSKTIIEKDKIFNR